MIPGRCPRCSGVVILDRRPGAYEPYCLPCGWTYYSATRLRLSRLSWLYDRWLRAHGMGERRRTKDAVAGYERRMAQKRLYRENRRRTLVQSG